jgi:hypothetical protein
VLPTQGSAAQVKAVVLGGGKLFPQAVCVPQLQSVPEVVFVPPATQVLVEHNAVVASALSNHNKASETCLTNELLTMVRKQCDPGKT